MLDHTKIKKGDRVRHRMFGDGTVTDTLPIGDDTIVTIEFDNGNKKKLCAVISALESADFPQNDDE
jgi:DNA helicase-2/ATP-dependent DNA helicase PcrA